MRRVVVTGVGIVCSLGQDVPATWEALVAGRSGLAPITLFDTKGFLTQVACEVKDWQPARHMDAKEARRRDRVEQFSTVAANQALLQSGLVATEATSEHIGAVVACGIGGLNTLIDAVHTTDREGPRRVSPFALTMIMANAAAGMICIDNGFRGLSYSPISACASGLDAVGQAFELVARGELDACVAGGCEAPLAPAGVAAMDRSGVMSRRQSGTPRPFDRERDGLAMGEGAGIVVLEELEFARARGAEILAEIAGYGATSDATHITAPAPDGNGMARAMRKALARGQVNPADVHYINAHGTATELNDRTETMAICSIFGPRAGGLPVSSTKSCTGHCMTATGALETVFCVQVLRTGVIPPTINYSTPDPECDVDVVPNVAREARVDVILNNAFGFGGHNAAVVLKAYR